MVALTPPIWTGTSSEGEPARAGPIYPLYFYTFIITRPQKPNKFLSSHPSSSKSPNFIKTNQIKVENNWRISYGQFGKIELEGKQAGPARKPGLSI
jgi:hypothetical protein